MRLNRKILGSILALSLLVSQSGCALSPLLWPLVIPGAFLASSGAFLIVDGNANYLPGEEASGWGSFFVGTILDEKNPGRLDAMNPLPKDDEFASKLGVNVDDIADYNDNLNQVQKVAGELTQDIRSQVNRVKQFNRLDQITSDAEINQIARKYGFENAMTFVDALKGDHLQTQHVKSFAKNVNLPTVQAKILLNYGFGIKTQN